MRLANATHKAMLFACKNFHYSKTMPVNGFGFSVYNSENEWCGCIIYGLGARNAGLKTGYKNQTIELVRMALNGKQESTSKALSISLKLIKKKMPYLNAIVSYADGNQNHIGIIYQATNWLYVGEYANERGIVLNGKLTHRRSINAKYNTSNIEWLKTNVDCNATVVKGLHKYKYYYLFDKSLLPLLQIKPYPKRPAVADGSGSGVQPETGGLTPTPPLHFEAANA